MTQIADRIFLGLFTLTMVMFAAVKPSEDAGMFWFARADSVGALSLLSLGLLGVVVLLDAIINDLLPERFHFHIGVKVRQSVWMWIGVTYIAYAFVNIKIGIEIWLALLYGIVGLRCCFVAIIDLQQSVASLRRNRRASDLKAEVKGTS